MTTCRLSSCDRERRAGLRKVLRRWLTLGAIVLAAGCATEPPTVFHTLLPLERPTPVSSAPGPVFRLEPVRVPDAVDQAQWLVRLADGTLAQLERERWASPPSNEIAQALRERLRLRFNMSEAAPSGSVAAVGAAWRIRVDVLRFESLPDEARLDAMWSVTRDVANAPGTALRCAAYIRQPAGGGMAALGEAHRRAVAELGDTIGEHLLAMARGDSAACGR